MPPTDLTTAGLLNSGAIHLLRGLRPVDASSGLTPARLSALSALVFGGPSTLTALARTEGVAGPTMTRIVTALVDLGLATRTAHKDNARMVTISATPAGSDLMHSAARRRLETINEAMELLPSADRRALCAAAPALRELARIIREKHG
ncbi:MarR family winged helix-turn-helix transcriptional regulator [Nesterenkonia ebinurensis]|uniref:MarR family winged helix-turn-helix transcriptional regulator n=1 Tax=Nesterenkonia ebinurensis TaxID=2608252 RepID=UPI00168BC33A|nr:MarR family winged helix-turn-helix transcriptional regulator [Nesterenkonia ebinurensis]